jgi:hypothetical protein
MISLPKMRSPTANLIVLTAFMCLMKVTAFVIVDLRYRYPSQRMTSTSTTAIGYEPKWKKETLAEQMGVGSSTVKDLKEIGIIGTVPVRWRYR